MGDCSRHDDTQTFPLCAAIKRCKVNTGLAADPRVEIFERAAPVAPTASDRSALLSLFAYAPRVSSRATGRQAGRAGPFSDLFHRPAPQHHALHVLHKALVLSANTDPLGPSQCY